MILKKNTNELVVPEAIGGIREVCILIHKDYKTPYRPLVHIAYNDMMELLDKPKDVDAPGVPARFAASFEEEQTIFLFHPAPDQDLEVRIVYFPPLKQI